MLLDSDGRTMGPILRLVPGGDIRLSNPEIEKPPAGPLRLIYRATLPDGTAIQAVREIEVKSDPTGDAVVETFNITPSRRIAADLEIVRPFSLQIPPPALPAEAVLPLYNGWARPYPLGPKEVRCEYRLGHAMTGRETPHLALPVASFSAGPRFRGAVMSDPTFSTRIDLVAEAKEIRGTLAYRYAASRVPIEGQERRTFGLWLAKPGSSLPQTAPLAGGLDAFFSLMLPDVPPGPRWLHEIAMIDYDYLSDNGQGWDRDLARLAEWLKPEERRRVALCLHGWYDAIGPYCFDAKTKQLKQEWTAFQPTRKVRLTQAEMKRRLRLARDLGFRALVYFADGLASDSGAPGYRDDWAWRDANGKKVAGWQGPDTLGPTYLLNPAHPEVFQFYLDYLDALLKTYGPETDGFVWDETFHARIGQLAAAPQPAYCDRAMLALVKELARRVRAADPQKVFLTSDCMGINGWQDVPGYAIVAHGTWQDSGCHPAAWSYGLFPNWRNVLWSCNWQAMTNVHYTRWGVQAFGAPVAISNGWGDDRGPSEWRPDERDALLRLFRQRSGMSRTRMLLQDPASLPDPDAALPAEPPPAPPPGMVNWALASQGARAAASSEDPQYPAAGAIDGVRDDRGWGLGHGWASADSKPLPQWLQVDLARPRSIAQFVVIAYQKDRSAETARKWGIRDYEIQAWDAAAGQWKTVARRSDPEARKIGHWRLAAPVRTEKIRLLVHRVAPSDGRTRLLQFEAWGAEK